MPPVGSQRPSATMLFQSLARIAGPRGLGVLLTGMGEDGAQGLVEMRQAGGYTIAEDESTAVVYGMPAAAVRMGGVASSLPLDLIAPRLLQSGARGCGRNERRPEPQAAGILLVEDSETQALQLRHVLETQRLQRHLAATAEAALDSLNEKLPDLVIADYHLPGMNGDELSRQMRLNVRTRAIPVIMLTEARERGGRAAGAGERRRRLRVQSRPSRT